jgi:hypothetical protein
MGLSTIVFLSIGTVVIAAVILALRAHLQSSTKEAESGAKKPRTVQNSNPLPKNPYRAISIVSSESSCAAVKAIGTKRFLVEDGDAPQLPLSDCDGAKCTCKYAHHEDRRDDSDDGDDRRALEGSMRTRLYEHTEEKDRRKKRGRRSSDRE